MMWNIAIAALVLASLFFASRFDNPLLWKTLVTIALVAGLFKAIRSPRVENILIAAASLVVGVIVYFPQLYGPPAIFLTTGLIVASSLAHTFRK